MATTRLSDKYACLVHGNEDCKVCFPHSSGCCCVRCVPPSFHAEQLPGTPKRETLPSPVMRPKTSAERKGEPIHSGVMLYFPDALAAVARVSKAGNDKHNPGEPLHWARGKSMDQMDCAARHSLTPRVVDPETGEIELAAQAWRVLAELQLAEEKRLVAAGIMPYSGIVE